MGGQPRVSWETGPVRGRRVPRIIPIFAGIGILLFVAALAIAWGGRAFGLWGPGAGPRTSIATLPPPVAWRSVTSAEGGFSIEFPGDPRAASSQEQGITAHGISLSTSDGDFAVGWSDVPEVATDYGPAVATGRAKALSATIVSEGGVEVGGLPGYQFVLAVPTACSPSIPGSCTLTWQVMPVGTRLYQILTAVPDPPGTSPLTDRFFTSFDPRQ